MRILVLTTDQPNQIALVRRLADCCELAGIVISANKPRRRPRRQRRIWANRLAGRTVGRPFTGAWFGMLARYERTYDGFPDVPQVEVGNVNDPTVVEAIADLAPDLLAVSG